MSASYGKPAWTSTGHKGVDRNHRVTHNGLGTVERGSVVSSKNTIHATASVSKSFVTSVANQSRILTVRGNKISGRFVTTSSRKSGRSAGRLSNHRTLRATRKDANFLAMLANKTLSHAAWNPCGIQTTSVPAKNESSKASHDNASQRFGGTRLTLVRSGSREPLADANGILIMWPVEPA